VAEDVARRAGAGGRRDLGYGREREDEHQLYGTMIKDGLML
jgi:hypothetical protein